MATTAWRATSSTIPTATFQRATTASSHHSTEAMTKVGPGACRPRRVARRQSQGGPCAGGHEQVGVPVPRRADAWQPRKACWPASPTSSAIIRTGWSSAQVVGEPYNQLVGATKHACEKEASRRGRRSQLETAETRRGPRQSRCVEAVRRGVSRGVRRRRKPRVERTAAGGGWKLAGSNAGDAIEDEWAWADLHKKLVRPGPHQIV